MGVAAVAVGHRVVMEITMDPRNPGRRAAHAAAMTRLVEAFASSGSTQVDFCRRNGLALSTFNYWRRRCASSEAPPFVEVEVAQDRPASAVELVLPGGILARVTDGCSDDLLRRLVRIASSSC